MRKDNTTEAFFALIRAGLWEKDVCLSSYGNIDYQRLLLLAEEQTVEGIISAGIEHVQDLKIPQDVALQFVGAALQIEQRNITMNFFIESLVRKMREADIYTLLVKGQGIAQCYERPLWRTSGDIDFLLSNDYTKANDFLKPLSDAMQEELEDEKHVSYSIKNWEVELHGTMRTSILKRVDKGIDNIQKAIFTEGRIRVWHNNKTDVYLPEPNDDVILVFTHYLKHFFNGGIGIRQICDWCRLLWTFREKIDVQLLQKRLKEMGILSEWKAFSAFAVEVLGAPSDIMPLFTDSKHWSRKSERLKSFIIESGNFGHNKDTSYFDKYPFVIRKAISLWGIVKDTYTHILIFPFDGLKSFCNVFVYGMKEAIKGK